MSEAVYEMTRLANKPELQGLWDGPVWGDVQPLRIEWYHQRSSDHQPAVQVKAGYDDAGVYVHFLVDDQYVAARGQKYQDMVCHDSCAEFFVQPKADKGFFNFEINCGGTMLLYYVRTPGKDYDKVDEHWLNQVQIYHSLPKIVDPELTEPTRWQLEYFVPYGLFEAYVGELSDQRPQPGVTWRGNWYKCADHTSHPHWGAWSPVGDPLNFHKPERFGTLKFG